jgi:hypothetical protein
VFPKVRSADHFRSARILKLVCEKINSTLLNNKTLIMCIMLKIFFFYGPQKSFLEMLWSAKMSFYDSWSASLKSLGITGLTQKRCTLKSVGNFLSPPLSLSLSLFLYFSSFSLSFSLSLSFFLSFWPKVITLSSAHCNPLGTYLVKVLMVSDLQSFPPFFSKMSSISLE